MLTRILPNSEKLCAFIDQLDMQLSQPQRRHIENMADALLVCESEKILSALQRQFVEAPDVSNMADFLRYRGRWSCEVDNFYLKTQAGLTDLRVRSYEAVDKYIVVVLLAWAYVERRYASERSAQIKTYSDIIIIRRHQDEHAADWLTGALRMVLDTGDIQQVLQVFLRTQPSPA